MATETISTEEVKHASAPPYNSVSTFTTFLDWIREMEVTPTHIDRSLWQTKFSGSVGTQLMTGLRFLRLLKGQQPTDELEELARASEEDRRPLLAALVLKVYGETVVSEMESGTPRRLNDALSALGTTTATHDKARSFLINTAKLAGLSVQPTISKQARIRKSGETRRRVKPKEDSVKEKVVDPGNSGEDSINTVVLPSGATVTLGVNMNPLTLSRDEREWLFTLIDNFNAFTPTTDQEPAEPSESAPDNERPQDSG